MQIIEESIKGRRETNQDYTNTVYNQNNLLMAVLCDGMGGHQAGDKASKLAVEAISEKWEKTDVSRKPDIIEWTKNSINEVNQLVYDKGLENSKWFGMGSTIVVCIVMEEDIIIANVGDSRAYQYINDEVTIITDDHSFAHELYLKGEITKEESETHRQKNVLTRSLGLPNDLNIDVFEIDNKNLKLLLLCSDGLSDTLSTDEMNRIINEYDNTSVISSKLIEQAYQNGSTDNITIIMIDFSEER